MVVSCCLLLGVRMARWRAVPQDDADIAGVFYINLDRSAARRERFLADYARHPIPGLAPVRFGGVVPNVTRPPPAFGYGVLGCALAHLRVLTHILRLDPKRWYLVCEDDATGRFSDLPALLRATPRRRGGWLPDITTINLYTPWPLPYGMGTGNVAYLVTPEGAMWMTRVLERSMLVMEPDVALAWSWDGFLHATAYANAMFPANHTSVRVAMGERMQTAASPERLPAIVRRVHSVIMQPFRA